MPEKQHARPAIALEKAPSEAIAAFRQAREMFLQTPLLAREFSGHVVCYSDEDGILVHRAFSRKIDALSFMEADTKAVYLGLDSSGFVALL